MSQKPTTYEQRQQAIDAVAARLVKHGGMDSNKAHEEARKAALQHDKDTGKEGGR